MKFVTAIYSKLYGTKFGGRLNRDRHYLYSLRSLLTMGVSFTCFTSSEEINELKEQFSEFDNIELVVYDLENYKYHTKIQEIKELNQERYIADDVWKYRSVELMWLKLEWLAKVASESDEKVFWIDSGLSHGGIIPLAYNKNHGIVDITYENSFENIKAFNQAFLNKLDKLSSDEIFSFYCTNRQHQYPLMFRDQPNLGGSIVAGLFGGKPEAIAELYVRFQKVIKDVMDGNDLIQEEMALTLVYKDYMDSFTIYEFGTWYHIDWDCFDPNQISFSSFFEDLHEWV